MFRLRPMRWLVVVFLFVTGQNVVATAADVLDLRVWPRFGEAAVDVEGAVVSAAPRVDATGRRARLKGFTAKWLATGFLTVHCASAAVDCQVTDGSFSCRLPVPSFDDFTIRVTERGAELYRERFSFPARADSLVVSDIDDTILVTEVTNRVKMIFNSLMRSVEKRQPVPGTPELYGDLRQAGHSLGTPHFVYLSSSPAVLSRLLKQFLKRHRFPAGTLVVKKALLESEHGTHKLGWLQRLRERYPGRPFILFGDSGEQDPFIYRDFVEQHAASGSVRAVVIRQVGAPESDHPGSALDTVRDALKARAVPFIRWTSIDQLRDDLRREKILP